MTNAIARAHGGMAANLGRERGVRKKLRKPGPRFGEAAAEARAFTGLRTYLVEGEMTSPAGKALEVMIENSPPSTSTRQMDRLRRMLAGCARGSR